MDSHLGKWAKKVRNRSAYSFANINLLGQCNVDCYFCLGLDLEKEFAKYNQQTTPFQEWKNWDKFIEECNSRDIRQIYVTGQNTDSLAYKYIGELVDHLSGLGFCVGLRTNGLLAEKKIDVVNRCTTCTGDAVSYSIHTLNPETQQKIMRVSKVPNWDWILRNTKARLRVAIVYNRYNAGEVMDLFKFLSNYENVEYIQVRRICTDNRYELLEPDMVLFEEFEKKIASEFKQTGAFETAKMYEIYGKKVSFWRTVGTTVNSINYFTNGELSDDYFIIEGYSKERGLPIGTKEFLGAGSWMAPETVKIPKNV